MFALGQLDMRLLAFYYSKVNPYIYPSRFHIPPNRFAPLPPLGRFCGL